MLERVVSSEVDGVPVVVGECPGAMAFGALLFRTGAVDERPLERGITHLIEHLALSPFDQRVVEFNGAVSPLFTQFVVRGDIGDVCRHLTAVARSLAALPLERATHEARILRAEASQRGPSAFGKACELRYGAAGFGTLDMEELFLLRPDAARVDAYRAECFVAENAAVVLSQPPTGDLRLDALPKGGRRPLSPVAPLPHRYPAWQPVNTSALAISTVLERRVAVPAAAWIVGEHLRNELRERHGLSYAAGSSVEPMSATTVHCVIHADCRPQDATTVAEQLQTELSRLALRGTTAEDLDAYRAVRRRGDLEPFAPYGRADFVARESLLGVDGANVEDVDAEITALVPADLDAVIDEIRAGGLWLVPRHVEILDRRLHRLVQWSDDRIDGRKFATIDPSLGFDVHVSPAGVGMHAWQPDRWLTVTIDRLVACKRWSDGARTLIGIDGAGLVLDPGIFMAGRELIAAVDEVVPPALVVETPDTLHG